DQDLKEEITPWLNQFKWYGYLGLTLLDIENSLNKGNLKQSWELVVASNKIKDKIIAISQNENLGRGVEVGGSALKPYLKEKGKKTRN
ncbi:hypothetical protein OAT16_11515, partial [Prolixibacteraceae bacterium]|nr:hypothetical protein [Prolixibacteraceae bacterium]